MIRRDDVITIVGKQHHGCVDHVGEACDCEEKPGRPAKFLIQSSNVDPGERL